MNKLYFSNLTIVTVIFYYQPYLLQEITHLCATGIPELLAYILIGSKISTVFRQINALGMEEENEPHPCLISTQLIG